MSGRATAERKGHNLRGFKRNTEVTLASPLQVTVSHLRKMVSFRGPLLLAVTLAFPRLYKGTALTRNSPGRGTPVTVSCERGNPVTVSYARGTPAGVAPPQDGLNRPPPSDHDRALGMFLLSGNRGGGSYERDTPAGVAPDPAP